MRQLTAALAFAVMLVLAAGCSTATKPPAPPTTSAPTSAPPVAVAALDGLLLSPDEITTIMGASHMDAAQIYEDLAADQKYALSNPNCTGALYSAQQSVYTGSGWSAVRNQLLQLGDASDPNYMAAFQAVVAFPSAEQAHAFLNTSTDKWKGCARQSMTDTQQNRWTFADVVVGDSKLVQMVTQEGANGFACQHTLSTVSNVVIEARTCGYHISNQATQIADKMAAKVPK